MIPARTALVLALLAGAASVGAQDWRVDATYTWAENLSRTSYAPDRENAVVLDGSVAVSGHRQLNADWSVLTDLEAGAEQVRAFPGLDSVHGGARLEFKRKFGLGPFAPTLVLGGSATRFDLHENARSHWNTEGSVTLNQRLTDTWRVAVGGRWDEDYARAHPFDVINRRLTAETWWEVREGWELDAGASRLWGQLTANANEDIFAQAMNGANGPAVAAYYQSIPVTHSTAFDTDWVAYRIDCHGDFWWLGLNVALGENTSLPLRYENAHVVNRAGVGYTSDFWSLSLVHRF